jgi:hypothetical protein
MSPSWNFRITYPTVKRCNKVANGMLVYGTYGQSCPQYLGLSVEQSAVDLADNLTAICEPIF